MQYELSILFSTDKSVRSVMANTIQQLAAKQYVAWSLDAEGKLQYSPLGKYTSEGLLNVLTHVATEPNFTFHNRADDYFALLKTLMFDDLQLLHQGKGKALPAFNQSYTRVWSILKSYRSYELTAGGEVDYVLCGLLDILKLMFTTCPSFKAMPQITHPLILEVWRKCLWDIPEFKDAYVLLQCNAMQCNATR